jgi:hypothetical protein
VEDVDEDAHWTPVAVRLPEVLESQTIFVTVAEVKISRFERGGRGSMYPEREYDLVQLEGLMAEVAM